MIVPMWFVIANMLFGLVWSTIVVFRIWSRTDRSVPFVEFCAVATTPFSRNWGGAYQWPGTYDPEVVRYWRERAFRAWQVVFLGLALQVCIAALIANFVLPHFHRATA